MRPIAEQWWDNQKIKAISEKKSLLSLKKQILAKDNAAIQGEMLMKSSSAEKLAEYNLKAP